MSFLWISDELSCLITVCCAVLVHLDPVSALWCEVPTRPQSEDALGALCWRQSDCFLLCIYYLIGVSSKWFHFNYIKKH